jgi:hypothetical protein
MAARDNFAKVEFIISPDSPSLDVRPSAPAGAGKERLRDMIRGPFTGVQFRF